MPLFNLAEKRAGMKPINDEMRFAPVVSGGNFESGVISFAPRSSQEQKLITHEDKEVVAQVIDGRGSVQIGDEHHDLGPGAVCHIPVNVPHDFYAAAGAPLVLFYLLIKSAG